MSVTEIIDDSFDKNITSSYFLSIQVSLNGLSFSVLDPVRNVYILFKHFEFEEEDKRYVKTQELLITDTVLNYDYKRVYVLFNTINSTLVPGALYNYEEAKQYLLFTTRISEEHNVIKSNKIKLADTWNVFAVPDFLYYLVKNQYDDVMFFQQYSPQIEANLITGVIGAEPVVYINIQDDIFDMVVLKKYNLLFCNSFRYSNPSEFAFFTLNTVKQLNLDRNNIEVFISGMSSVGNSCFSILAKYLKKVKLIRPPQNFEFSYHFRDISIEEYYNLFCLPLCV